MSQPAKISSYLEVKLFVHGNMEWSTLTILVFRPQLLRCTGEVPVC